MKQDDIETFKEAKPFIIGVLAGLMQVCHVRIFSGRGNSGTAFQIPSPEELFDKAEALVAEFEKRNGI